MENNHHIIYYFSGTGNARNVANWIKATFDSNGKTTTVIDISKLANRKEIQISSNTLIGFCCPTHGFNFPPIMFHFLLRFPRAKNNSAYIINTRAGMKAGKLFLPGISGLAQFFSALILILKGHKIVSMYPVDLPSNWISFHPGIKEKVIKSIYEKRKKQTIDFAQNLIEGKKNYKGLRAILIDIAITPIALAYYIFGRFILAKSFYASHNCTNCNVCIKKCPVQAIKIVDKRPFWTYKCESCMQCMSICPEQAIETAHGFVFAFYFLIKLYLIYKIYDLFKINYYLAKILPEWLSDTFQFFIDASLIVFIFIISYRIFHFLLRFTFFERIIWYTSLTKWKFWRRYKIMNNF